MSDYKNDLGEVFNHARGAEANAAEVGAVLGAVDARRRKRTKRIQRTLVAVPICTVAVFAGLTAINPVSSSKNSKKTHFTQFTQFTEPALASPVQVLHRAIKAAPRDLNVIRHLRVVTAIQALDRDQRKVVAAHPNRFQVRADGTVDLWEYELWTDRSMIGGESRSRLSALRRDGVEVLGDNANQYTDPMMADLQSSSYFPREHLVLTDDHYETADETASKHRDAQARPDAMEWGDQPFDGFVQRIISNPASIYKAALEKKDTLRLANSTKLLDDGRRVYRVILTKRRVKESKWIAQPLRELWIDAKTFLPAGLVFDVTGTPVVFRFEQFELLKKDDNNRKLFRLPHYPGSRVRAGSDKDWAAQRAKMKGYSASSDLLGKSLSKKNEIVSGVLEAMGWAP